MKKTAHFNKISENRKKEDKLREELKKTINVSLVCNT
jgi:hypothetical protein